MKTRILLVQTLALCYFLAMSVVALTVAIVLTLGGNWFALSAFGFALALGALAVMAGARLYSLLAQPPPPNPVVLEASLVSRVDVLAMGLAALILPVAMLPLAFVVGNPVWILLSSLATTAAFAYYPNVISRIIHWDRPVYLDLGDQKLRCQLGSGVTLSIPRSELSFARKPRSSRSGKPQMSRHFNGGISPIDARSSTHSAILTVISPKSNPVSPSAAIAAAKLSVTAYVLRDVMISVRIGYSKSIRAARVLCRTRVSST